MIRVQAEGGQGVYSTNYIHNTREREREREKEGKKDYRDTERERKTKSVITPNQTMDNSPEV